MEYGLLGKKLAHSYSVKVHKEFADYNYVLKEIAEEELEEFFKKREFKGINVTIPYKKTVIPYLDFISPEAKEIGAVNTVVNEGGRLYGYNTDYFGLKYIIESAGIGLKGKTAIILGSGGTSNTASKVALDLSAEKIVKVSRTGEVNYQNVYDIRGGVIINTTPVGMFPDIDACPVDLKRFENLSGVVDCVYNPLKTELVLSAKKLGIPSVGGIGMLVSQGAYASAYFTKTEVKKDKISNAVEKIVRSIENIVLIGMPGCGKSTIARGLSKMTGREVVDTDELIVKKEGMSIPEIFGKKGEGYFRSSEREVIKECSALTGRIIATGGGAVKDESNVLSLKKNGKIYYVKRDIGLLEREGRPLSIGNDLKKLFNERRFLYESAADKTVDNDGDIEGAIKKIAEDVL